MPDSEANFPAADFPSFLEQAENEALRILCAATGFMSGRSAFIGSSQPYYNAFAFGLRGTAPNETAMWSRFPMRVLPLNAKAVGTFANRAEMWRWCALILQGLPIQRSDGNAILETFRVSSIADPYEQDIAFPGESQVRRVSILTINFQLVAITGGKDESQTADVEAAF